MIFSFFYIKVKEQNDIITNPSFLLIFISANLVEGYGRASQKDKAHFTNVSYSSALETLDHLITSYDVEYLKNEDYLSLRSELSGIIAMLNGLYKYQSKQKENLRDQLS